MRLHLTDFGDHVARGLAQVIMRRVAPVKPARLKPEDGARVAQQMREVAQVEHVAEHPRDKEERRARPALAAMHGHEVGKATLFGRGGDGGFAGLLRAGLRLDERRAGADGGGLEQHRDREIHPIGAADHGEEPHRDERMAPQIEKTVLGPDLIEPQKIAPEPGEPRFDLALGGDVIARQIGPGKARAASATGAVAASGLRDERVEIDRRDKHLRAAPRAHPAERLGPLLGPDTVAQRRREPGFCRGFGGWAAASKRISPARGGAITSPPSCRRMVKSRMSASTVPVASASVMSNRATPLSDVPAGQAHMAPDLVPKGAKTCTVP